MADAPALTSVTADPSGRRVTLTAEPASGTFVEQYVWSWRHRGHADTTIVVTTGPTLVQDGFTPGARYQFWAQVDDSSGRSPASNLNTVDMPMPAPVPGIFWDGGFDDQPTVEYSTAWPNTGTYTNDGLATPTGGVEQWVKGSEITAVSGGEAFQMQTHDLLVEGESSTAALYIWRVGATENGARMGTDGSVAGGSVTPGVAYVGSLHVRPSQTKVLAARLLWYSWTGTFLSESEVGTAWTIEADEIRRISVQATAPASAAYAGVIVTDPEGTDTFASGDSVAVDGAMLSVGVLYPYFYSGTPDTGEWDYQSVGSPRGSYARRVAKAPSSEDPLADPDCPPLPSPPRPPVVENDCVEAGVTEWRRYWVPIDSTDVSVWAESVPTITLTTHDLPERLVRIRYFPNPEGVPSSDFIGEEYAAEQIISYIPADTSLTIDGVSRRAWASVDGGGLLPADHLLYGSNGSPATWPSLECGTAWLIAVDVPRGSSVAGNLSIDVSLTRRS